MPTVLSGKSTNVTLDNDLLAEVKALEMNLSRAAEESIRLAVVRSRSEQWLEENHEALESSNEYVEKRGLSLGHLRHF